LTLIEVLVSLVIVFIVFLGISASGLLVLEENIRNSLRDEAVSVAEMDVQEARNLPFASLVSDNTVRIVTPARKVRGFDADYTVQRTVTDLDGSTKQLAVTVRWTRYHQSTRQLRSYSHQVATIVRQ
jgi:type IV pilus assembly protein PilV